MHTTTQSPVWRRTGRAGIAVTATALAVTVAAVAPAVAGAALNFKADLRDFAPAASGPFDAARAKLTLASPADSTQAVFVVHGVDRSVAGQTFGAHLHNGPCVAGNGAAALGHYNHSSTVPATVNDQTEIWLDITVDDEGNAQSSARVDWAPSAGARSVVVHANPTAPDGTAGARLACLPVEW
jgi:Cu/Zn superoxide dismutase